MPAPCDFQLEEQLKLLEADKLSPSKFNTIVSDVNRHHASKRVAILLVLAKECAQLARDYPETFSAGFRIDVGATLHQVGMGPSRNPCLKVPGLSFQLQAAHTAPLNYPTTNLKLLRNVSSLSQEAGRKGWTPSFSEQLRAVDVTEKAIEEIEVSESLFHFLNQSLEAFENGSEEVRSRVAKAIADFSKEELEYVSKALQVSEDRLRDLQPLVLRKIFESRFEFIFHDLCPAFSQQRKLRPGQMRLLALMRSPLEYPSEIIASGPDHFFQQLRDRLYLLHLIPGHKPLPSYLKSLSADKLQALIKQLKTETPLFDADHPVHVLLPTTDLIPNYINNCVDSVSGSSRSRCRLTSDRSC